MFDLIFLLVLLGILAYDVKRGYDDFTTVAASVQRWSFIIAPVAIAAWLCVHYFFLGW